MYIRITFSLSYYKYIYSSDISSISISSKWVVSIYDLDPDT